MQSIRAFAMPAEQPQSRPNVRTRSKRLRHNGTPNGKERQEPASKEKDLATYSMRCSDFGTATTLHQPVPCAAQLFADRYGSRSGLA